MAQAKELTAREHEDRVQACFQLNEEVKKGLRAGREALWQLAMALSEFDEAVAYKELGYETLNQWLAEPDIGIARSTYFRLVRCFRALTDRKVPPSTLAELEISKVSVVLPALKAGEVALDKALDDVKALGWRDLRREYAGAKEAEDDIVEGNVSDEPPPEDDPEYEPPSENEDLDRALADWTELRDELVGAVASGAPEPRVNARLIQRGVAGVDLIFQRGGIVFDGDAREAA